MKSPRVIGFVPTYNAEKFLEKTLTALAAIQYPNFKIIIGDDCSTDRTFEIANTFAGQDSRFKVFQNKENLGWLKNSEKLWILSAKDSEYCFINPHDDPPYPNFISKQLEALMANQEAVLCCPQMINRYDTGEVSKSQINSLGESENLVERVTEIIRRNTNFWWAAYHGLHRSDIVLKIIPMKKRFFGNGEFSKDLIWLMKMAFYGKFITIPELLFEKSYSKKTLSQSWKHTSHQKFSLWAVTIQEILDSEIPLKDKLKLLKIIVFGFIPKIKRRLLILSK